MELVEAAIIISDQHVEDCNVKMMKLTDGQVDKATQVARMKKWIGSQGVYVDSLDKAAIAQVISDGVDPKILEVLRLRQQVARTSVKKYEALKNAVTPDGRVKDLFVYHGASTGRWTGKIVQPHNLPRGSVKDVETCIKAIKTKNLNTIKFLYPNVMDAISSCVRGALIAAPGKDLLCVDFASIEARGLAWLANEEEALNEFKTGEDSYVKMAEAIFDTTTINKDQRFVGKTAVLGCGYGMGWKVFQASCASMGQEVSEGLARIAVTAFRKKNAKIKQLWQDVENAAMNTIKTGNSTSVNDKPVIFTMLKDFLYCGLPSGRKLAYHLPQIRRVEKFDNIVDEISFMGVSMGNKYTRQGVWGGTLVENIIQAICRDLLAEAMLRVEAAGYPVVLHVHDEIVSEVKEKTKSLNEFTDIITQVPKWATGFPIAAEGWRGKRYKK
jgi:DNA polymerase